MDLSLFKWLNETSVTTIGDEIAIYAPAYSDYFNNPIPEDGKFTEPQANAPFLYKDIEGDFVIKAKVRPDFKTTFDAACIIVFQDEKTWVKAAFEKSDFDTNAVVSVVTNTISDDAKGCNIEGDSVWLQIARVGNNFAIHYSLDGERYDMVRVFYLPVANILKIGIEAQCPMGEGGLRYFSHLSIEKKTIESLRAGE
ncbi:MAG: DUF1349 domain-containing protein [Clostridiaceae bacterium]|nr:DUF1349 domain-containing protein [Clostridiaceae bacterium]